MAEDVFPDESGLPNTRWSQIELAKDPSSQEGHSALDALLAQYRPALLSHLRSKFRLSWADAEDTLHAFVEKKILNHNFLGRADRGRGRFRNLLLASLDRFAISELRRARALKRTPRTDLLPLHDVSDEVLPVTEPSRGSTFDLDWSRVVLAGVLLNMKNECDAEQREALWAVFLERVVEPMLAGEEPTSYDDLVEHHDLNSPSDAFNLLGTAKRKFRRHMRSVVAEYAGSELEVEEELIELQRLLAQWSERS